MASTLAAARLTETHRLQQIRLRTMTARDLITLWSTFDMNEITESWSAVETGIVALIQARQPVSAGLTAGYFSDFHRLEKAPGKAVLRLAPNLTAGEIVPNLRLLGPGAAGRLIGTPNAARTVFSNVEGEVTRQVLNGGRTTLTQSVQATKYCIGYVRVSDGSPCAFCAMLIGRGPVYGPSAAHFDAHRKCGCTAEPVYRMDQPLPNKGQTERYAAIYDQIPKDLSSKEVRAEFRRLYNA